MAFHCHLTALRTSHDCISSQSPFQARLTLGTGEDPTGTLLPAKVGVACFTLRVLLQPTTALGKIP